MIVAHLVLILGKSIVVVQILDEVRVVVLHFILWDDIANNYNPALPDLLSYFVWYLPAVVKNLAKTCSWNLNRKKCCSTNF